MKYLLIGLMIGSAGLAQASARVGESNTKNKNVSCPICEYMSAQKMQKSLIEKTKQPQREEATQSKGTKGV